MGEKHSVVFLIFYDSIFQCTPWMNSIALLNEKGYNIIVYQRRFRKGMFNAKKESASFFLKEIKLNIVFDFILRIIGKATNLIGRLFNDSKLLQISDVYLFCFSIKYVNFIVKEFRGINNNKHVFIAGDPVSLMAAEKLHDYFNFEFIYWGLELYVKKELTTIFRLWLKKKEILANSKAAFSIEFGPNRKKLLVRENNIKEQDIILIPNSPIGNHELRREYYFNEKFGIPKDKIIILNAGGLSDSNSIPQLLKYTKDMPEDIVLVLHSKVKLKSSVKNRIQKIANNKKVFINDEPLPFAQLSKIYSSCDIGLVLMSPAYSNKEFYSNLYYVDWSSGKMFNYLKYGKPIITFALPGYNDLINNNYAGVCITGLNSIFSSVNEIISQYKKYQLGAIKLYEKLKFEDYHVELEHRIKNILDKS